MASVGLCVCGWTEELGSYRVTMNFWKNFGDLSRYGAIFDDIKSHW